MSSWFRPLGLPSINLPIGFEGKRLRVSLLVLAFGFCSIVETTQAALGEFKVATPKTWRAEFAGVGGEVFRNETSRANEMVALHVVDIGPESEWTSDFKQKKVDGLKRAREKVMERMGLSGYTVLEVQSKAPSDRKFRYIATIESRFRSSRMKDVQVLERQYVGKRKLFVVTYSIDGATIPDRRRAETVMNWFTPIPEPSRLPASEIVETSTGTTARSGSIEEPTSAPVRDLDMSLPENARRCEHVPPHRRRGSDDRSFTSVFQSSIGTRGNCLVGVVDGAWDLASGAAGMIWSMFRYQLSSSYREQVNAATGAVVSELVSSPRAFASRVSSELWNRAAQATGDFFVCLKPEVQTQIVCKIALDLVGGGVLTKVVTRAPLTAAEAAQMRSVITNHVNASSPAAGPAGPRLAQASASSLSATSPQMASRSAATVQSSAERVAAIRNDFPELALIRRDRQGPTLRAIDELRSAGVSNDCIRAEIARPGTCR